MRLVFLEKFETELVQFIREKLRNDHVVLKKEIADIQRESKLYTNRDIYNYMVKQNPDLQVLKDRLELDL